MPSKESLAALIGPASLALREILTDLLPGIELRVFEGLHEALLDLRGSQPGSLWIDGQLLGTEDLGTLRLLRRLYPEAQVALILGNKKSKLGGLAAELGMGILGSPPQVRQILPLLKRHEEPQDLEQELIAGFADQLNNPLAALIGRLQLMSLSLPKDLPQDLVDNLAFATSSAERLRESLSKLTLLARRRSPNPRLQPLGATFVSLMEEFPTVQAPDLGQGDPIVQADDELLLESFRCLLRVGLDLGQGEGRLASRLGTIGGQAFLELELPDPLPLPCRIAEILAPYRLNRLLQDPDLGLDLAVAKSLLSSQEGDLEVRTGSGFLQGFRVLLPQVES